MSGAGKGPRPLVALSTASVFPDRTADAFEVAARLGYDGVEVMVSADAVSQDVEVLRRLADYHGVPVLAVHAPCLLITQRVWGASPGASWSGPGDGGEAGRAGRGAASPVPLAARLREGLRARPGADERGHDVIFAVENMYPLRAGGAEVAAYAPHWNPS